MTPAEQAAATRHELWNATRWGQTESRSADTMINNYRAAILREAAAEILAENATCPDNGHCFTCNTRARIARKLRHTADNPTIKD